MHPIVLARLLQIGELAGSRPSHGLNALIQHQAANRAQKDDIEQRDDEIELAKFAQQDKDINTDTGAGDAAYNQQRSELEVERAAFEMGQGPAERRSNDLVGASSNCNRRWNIVENQQRRDQKPAADAKHARQKPHRRAHKEEHEDIDRNLGYRQVNTQCEPQTHCGVRTPS